MPQFTLYLENGLLRESLYSRLRRLSPAKLSAKGNLLYCLVKDSDKCVEDLSRILCEFILNDYEKYLIWEKTYSVLDCFSWAEGRILADNAIWHAAHDTFEWGVFAGPDREERLTRVLRDYFRQTDYLDIKGFIDFRLLGYKEYLLAILAVVADEYLGMEEDREYNLLLRDILFERKPSHDELHLLISPNGLFHIYSKDKNDYILLEGGKSSGYEDLLISQMIMMAPAKLFLHSERELKKSLVYKCLSEIFSERLVYCEGCNLSNK